MIGPLLVADAWTFSETEVSHKKSRNNLTPPRAITIKLEPLIFIEKKKQLVMFSMLHLTNCAIYRPD